METTAYIALGANLGDRAANLRGAVEMLAASPGVRVVAVSPFFETEPEGYTDQPAFINAAAEVSTTLSPRELLELCLDVENRAGRVRTQKWGPRTLDLDILMYGDIVMDTEELKIPHPLMHVRRFVLEPLAEIAPDAVHPVTGRTITRLLEEVSS